MANETYIKYFADLFKLRRNLNSMILEYKSTRNYQLISEAFNTYSNEMDIMDSRLDLLYDHRKKLLAQNSNTDSHRRMLRFEIINSQKVFKLFSRIEEEEYYLWDLFDKVKVFKRKKVNRLRKYRLNAMYKTYDKKCNSTYAKWEHRNSKVCTMIDQLMDEFQLWAREHQWKTEKMCEDLDYNGDKNMVFECETIIEKSLLKVKSMIKFNLFDMKTFMRQQKSCKTTKEKKPIRNRKRQPQKGIKCEQVTEMQMAQNVYQFICEEFIKMNSLRSLLLPINWKFRKKLIFYFSFPSFYFWQK